MVAFFVYSPEGTKHGLNIIKSKIHQHIYFQIFWKIATFILGQKKVKLKIKLFIDVVFLHLPDLPRYWY